MDIKNLKRAAEINALMNVCIAVRKSITNGDPIIVNGIELPHEMSNNILQVINIKINQIYDEIKTL